MEDLNGKNHQTKMTIKYSISRLLTYSGVSIVFSAIVLSQFNGPDWIMGILPILNLYFDPKKLVITNNGVFFSYYFFAIPVFGLKKKHFNSSDYDIIIREPIGDSYILQISKKNYKKNLLKRFIYWVHFNANIDDLDQVYEVIDVLKKLGYTVNVPFENKRW